MKNSVFSKTTTTRLLLETDDLIFNSLTQATPDHHRLDLTNTGKAKHIFHNSNVVRHNDIERSFCYKTQTLFLSKVPFYFVFIQGSILLSI